MISVTQIDIILRNGTIIDGTGNPGYRSDLAIKDGRIIAIKKLREKTAEKEINVKNFIVAPGFIDPHSHSDFSIHYDNRLESTIRQGITTIAVGMCGTSLAPVDPDKIEEFRKEIEMFSPPGKVLNITWRTFGDYLRELEYLGCSTNIIPFVGFGTVRIAGGPGYEDRKPTHDELERMKDCIKDAMEAGAFGLTTGLIYSPQIYADTEEIIELTKVVAKYNGLYFSHIRGEGETVVSAVNELIKIVEESGCTGGQIAHHKVSLPQIWGASKETLALIEVANQRGLNITADQYPYNRGMTSLITILPPWVHIGGVEKILERLKNPKDCERIRKDFVQGIKGWENWMKDLGPENVYIATVKTDKWKDVEGKSLQEIAETKGYTDVVSALFELLLD